MPASVLSYFTDKRTRMATDLLLAKKTPPVPEDVGWIELRGFYQANLAAKQIEAEHAIFLNELWEETCKPMASPWKPSEPHQQTEDCSTDIRTIWNESCFTREFLNDDYGCEIVTCVGRDEGIQVGYGLWHKGESLFENDPPTDWENPEEMLWSPEGAVPIAAEIDLLTLRELAKQGMAFMLDVLKMHERGI
jgi:hypothetical protein